MMRRLAVALSVWLAVAAPAASEWRAEIVPAPGRVTAIEARGAETRIAIGPDWYRLADDAVRLEAAAPFDRPIVPAGGLADGQVAVGGGARVWLAEPTERYRHGVLGDAIEAASLVIERRSGRRTTLRLGADAVFEDLTPRIAEIGGRERVVVVKSYLARGAALAMVDVDTATIVAETPPIGRANAWLNPAGVADFDGDGTVDIALVRQPHVVGRLELWSWSNGGLKKSAELGDVSNHAIGSRALGLSAVHDFDRDGRPDLAVPSLDRGAVRLIAFAPKLREIGRVGLPARVATNMAAITIRGGPAVVVGLESGQLALIRR
jgi:hypothetical protein